MMETPHMIYTGKVVDQIRTMIESGKGNAEIAEVLGTTEERLKARLSQLGIKRPDRNGYGLIGLRVRLPIKLIEQYSFAAHKRHVTMSHLISDMLARVAQDNLFNAILDDE